MSSANEIRDLNKIYMEAVYGGGKKKEAPKDDRMVVTAADKKGNTPAYQKYKAGAKSVKTGKPLYKAADHLKDDKDWGYDKDGNSLNPVDIEKKKKKDDDLAGSPNVKKESYETKKKAEVLSAMKRQGRKLSDKEKEKIANKVVTSKGDTSKSDDRYAYEEVQNEGLLVKAAGAVEKTAGAINRADKKAFSAIQRGAGKVAKGAAKVVGKGVKKVASATVRGAAGAVSGAVKGAAKGVKKGLSEEQLELQNIRALVEKEVKVKDTRRTVDAIRAYDKSKDASRDATWDTEHGKIKQGDIEKKYAAKERGEIDKDDPNWKKRKYHTGIHGEEVEALVASGKFSNEELVKITNLQEADIADILARLEKKRISKGGDPDESPLGKETGRAMKAQQDKQREKAKKK